jgi:hypothetical protein
MFKSASILVDYDLDWHIILYPNSRPPKRSKMPGSLHVFELQHNLGYIKEKKKGKENIIRYPEKEVRLVRQNIVKVF